MKSLDIFAAFMFFTVVPFYSGTRSVVLVLRDSSTIIKEGTVAMTYIKKGNPAQIYALQFGMKSACITKYCRIK